MGTNPSSSSNSQRRARRIQNVANSIAGTSTEVAGGSPAQNRNDLTAGLAMRNLERQTDSTLARANPMDSVRLRATSLNDLSNQSQRLQSYINESERLIRVGRGLLVGQPLSDRQRTGLAKQIAISDARLPTMRTNLSRMQNEIERRTRTDVIDARTRRRANRRAELARLREQQRLARAIPLPPLP